MNQSLSKIWVAIIVLLSFTSMNAQILKAKIRATGLTCSMCSNAIYKQLKSLPEVVNVETDLNTNTFTVTLAANNSATPNTFREKVEKAGFFIGSLVLTVDAATISKKPYIIVKNTENKTKALQIQVLDKGFVTDKEFKKLSKTYKNIDTYLANSENYFHVKLVN